MANRNGHARLRAGFSLLELLLALALSGLILFACSMAVDLHLRVLDSRRTNLEEAQLARSVLNMIANDLRGTLRYEKVDMSAIQQLVADSIADASAGGGGGVVAHLHLGVPPRGRPAHRLQLPGALPARPAHGTRPR